jgi:hypothetical protein
VWQDLLEVLHQFSLPNFGHVWQISAYRGIQTKQALGSQFFAVNRANPAPEEFSANFLVSQYFWVTVRREK